MFKLRRWSQTTNNGKTVNKMSIHHEAHEGHEDKANQKNTNYFHKLRALRVLRGEYAVLNINKERSTGNDSDESLRIGQRQFGQLHLRGVRDHPDSN